MSTLKIRVGQVTVPVYGAASDGKQRFEVRWRAQTKVAVTTEIRREKFSIKSRAETRAREIATRIQNGSIALDQLTGDDALKFLRMMELGQKMSKDPEQLLLLDYDAWQKEQKLTGPGGATITEVLAKFIDAKKSEGCSDYYLRDFKQRLGRLAGEFKLLPFSHLTSEDTQTFLDELKVGPRTWNNHLAAIRSLASFAMKRKLLPKDWDALEGLTARKLAWKRPDILTPGEMRTVLEAAGQPLRRCLALAGFAGLRTEEVHRIMWEDFKWEQGYIHVSEDIAKTRQHDPPILDALKAWIGTIETNGRFCPYKTAKSLSGMRTNLLARLNLRARRNPLRKSYISYRLALIQAEAKVADEAGTSLSDLNRHYLNRPSQAEGQKWFAIRPNCVPENLIQLPLSLIS